MPEEKLEEKCHDLECDASKSIEERLLADLARAGIEADAILDKAQRETLALEARYECPCCMTDLRGSARACPTCKINLPRDWLDARLWSMFGVTKEVEAKLVEYRCPLCDQPTGADYECGDCGGIPATPRLRGVEDGED